MNKGISLVILSIIGLSLIAGCIGTSPSVDSPTNTNPISAKSPDWCKVGSKSTTTTNGITSSEEIIGIVDFKGHTVCQTDIVVPGTYTLTSYVNKDGTYSYYIMKDSTGKVINEGEQITPK